MPRSARLLAALVCLALAACGGGGSKATGTSRATSSSPTSTTATPPGSAASAAGAGATGGAPCRGGGRRPARYEHVVVFSFENRTWSGVGGPGFPAMPYLHGLASACPFFRDWTEADTSQNSATQYVSEWQGSLDHTVRNDCSPGPTCQSTAPNIGRQLRDAHRTVRSFVEGPTSGCSADGNAAKHVAALYFRSPQDAAACEQEVRPLSELDVDHLPAFSFITPNLCNDGHDCGNDVVDRWARAHVQPLLDSPAYRDGTVLVEIWYDEDHPVPNLYLAPTGRSGPLDTPGIGYAATLAAWESALGLPCLANACGAPDLRAAANL